MGSMISEDGFRTFIIITSESMGAGYKAHLLTLYIVAQLEKLGV